MIDSDQLTRLLDDHASALELYAAQWAESPADIVQVAFIRLAAQSPLPERNRPLAVSRRAECGNQRGPGRESRTKHERTAAGLNRSWFTNDDEAPLDAETATEALQALADEFREALVARIWGGLSFEEIGEVTEVSSSTAHRRYESALRKLRIRLGVSCETTCETLTTN